MKKPFLLFPVVAAAGLLVASPSAKAWNLKPELVTTGSTFNFDLAAGNTSTGKAYYITPIETTTFGTTQTYTGAGVDGQNITITSSENLGATTTTDTFTVTTPTNFLNDTSLTTGGGTSTGTLNTMQFDLGNANSGGPVMLALPIASYSATGSLNYVVNGSPATFTLTPQTSLGTNNLSYSAFEGFNSGSTTTAASAYGINTFTYSITYSTATVAPEPSTWAMLGLGGIAGILAVRRKLVRA